MGQVLHGSATTTEAIRRAIQHSQESLRSLARRFGINSKTVAKWRKRETVTDRPTGPRADRGEIERFKVARFALREAQLRELEEKGFPPSGGK